jgi:RNA-directed DNA polymerase
VLSISTIRDRVVQGALKLILEPIFEADFQSGSYGYRPQRSAHEAVERVAQAIVHRKTRVLDLDLRSFFDNIRHHILFEKVAGRVNDPQVMHLLKLLVKATGTKSLPRVECVHPCSATCT